jgi:hypothetical protein
VAGTLPAPPYLRALTDKVDKIDCKDINCCAGLFRHRPDRFAAAPAPRPAISAESPRREACRFLALLPYTAEHIRRYG